MLNVMERQLMKRNVLVIGNSDYLYLDKITSCIYDAEKIYENFKLLSFHNNTKITDVSFADMKDKIDAFSDNYACDSLNIIYFSGHGFSYNGENYITGTNAKSDNTIIDNSISINYIFERYKERHAYIVLIVDACRKIHNDTLNINPSFSDIKIHRDVLIAYATQYGEIASGENRRRLSPFTKAICNNMLKSELLLNNLFQKVRGELINDKYVQLSCEISTLTQEIPLTCAYVDATDEAIYEFVINKRHGSTIEAVLNACDIFDRSYLDIYYSISKVSYKKMYKKCAVPLLSKLEENAFCFNNLIQSSKNKSMGITYDNFRWYYKGRNIRVGEIPPLPYSMAPKKPIKGKELNVNIKCKVKKLDDKIKIEILTKKLPNDFPLHISLSPNGFSSSHKVMNQKVNLIFDESELTLSQDNKLFIGISSPLINESSKNIFDIVGEYGRNLCGNWVEFSNIIGNQIKYEQYIDIETV